MINMKIDKKILFLAMIISGIVIVSFAVNGLYTVWSAEQEALQQMSNGATVGSGPQEIFNEWMEREFLIIVNGVVMWSIIWFLILTVLLYLIIKSVKKWKK
jgi:hypothetical protein